MISFFSRKQTPLNLIETNSKAPASENLYPASMQHATPALKLLWLFCLALIFLAGPLLPLWNRDFWWNHLPMAPLALVLFWLFCIVLTGRFSRASVQQIDEADA